MKPQTSHNVVSYIKTTSITAYDDPLPGKRRTRLRAILAIAAATETVLLLTTTPANAAAPPINLIVNAGFETGDLTGWSVTGATDGDVTNTEAHNGTYSMQMEAVDFIYQRFDPAAKLHAKVLRFWAKADSFAGPAYAIVSYLDHTSDSISFGGGSITSTGWTKFTLGLKPGNVVFELLIETGETEPIYVDDVQLMQFP